AGRDRLDPKAKIPGKYGENDQPEDDKNDQYSRPRNHRGLSDRSKQHSSHDRRRPFPATSRQHPRIGVYLAQSYRTLSALSRRRIVKGIGNRHIQWPAILAD